MSNSPRRGGLQARPARIRDRRPEYGDGESLARDGRRISVPDGPGRGRTTIERETEGLGAGSDSDEQAGGAEVERASSAGSRSAGRAGRTVDRGADLEDQIHRLERDR